MQVGEVMTRDITVVSPHASIRDAARKMDQLNVGALPVCDGARLVGMITDRDITVRCTAIGLPPDSTRVHDVMTDDVHWCFEDDPVEQAEAQMAHVQIRRVPVLDRRKSLVGIVSLGDLASGQAPGTEETLRVISQPAEPDRSGTPGGRAHSGQDQRGTAPNSGAAGSRALKNHRGRGPRGYRRSDERIREDMNERLLEDPDLDATNIEVGVHAGEITLSGTVGSRYDKRRAEDLAESILGVAHVQSNLSVFQELTTGNPTGIAAAGSEGRAPPKLAGR